MTLPRARDGDLCMTEAMPFCQRMSLRTVHPLAQCLTDPMFLMDVRQRLQAGDTLTLYRFANESWGEVIEVCPMAVVHFVDASGVQLTKCLDIVTTGMEAEEDIVVTRGFRGRFVVRLNGRVDSEWPTAVEADEAAEKLSSEINCKAKYYTAKAKQKHGQLEAN